MWFETVNCELCWMPSDSPISVSLGKREGQHVVNAHGVGKSVCLMQTADEGIAKSALLKIRNAIANGSVLVSAK